MLRYQKSASTKEILTQVKLYTACKEAGLDCDMEYSITAHWDGQDRDVPDFILVACNQIIAIVEVKNYFSFNNLSPFSKNQIERYEHHSIPVFILYSTYDIPYLVKRLVEIKTKFLESCDPTKIKCFESDKQNEEKWNEKIAMAFSKFDEVFPDYKFTNECSLEILATGVKVLGLSDLLKLMDEYSKSGVKDFLFAFSSLLDYKKGGRERFLDVQKGTILSISGYHDRQDRIDEKLK